MPVNYQIEGDVVVIRPVGAHSTRELMDAWLAAENDVAFPQPPALPRICIDTRQSASLAERSIAEMRAAAAWFIDRTERTSRLCAWVTRPGVQYGLARMMGAWIELKGFRVYVTTDLEAAIAWLGASSR